MLRQNSDDELQWLTSSDSSSYGTTLSTTAANITAGTAYRIAVDKDATGTVRIWVDGVMKAKATPADSVIYGGGNTPVTVGIDGLGGRENVRGRHHEAQAQSQRQSDSPMHAHETPHLATLTAGAASVTLLVRHRIRL